jgi:Xaa-Pro aminopeptidase
VIEEAKLGEFFSHRTGHNIFESVHGPGAHLDAFETVDDRPLISSTCFTIEPGLYFPNQYGVRVEYDVFIHVDGKAEITSGVQNEIFLFD